MSRHLLSAADLSRDEAVLILDTAEEMSRLSDRSVKKLPTLRGRTVVNLFFEDSTRTRTSFEVAAKRLSADVINFSAKGSSLSKGESLKDTALTLEAMGADAVVIRHGSSGAPHRLAGWIRGSVLNAGDGTHEHPTQALLDAFTMRRRHGRVAGLNVAIVGDVLHSRVARSNVVLLSTLGAQVTLVAPPTLLPVGVEAWPAAVSYDLDAVLPKCDVVMMLRVQRERMDAAFFPTVREYSRRYGLDRHRVAALGEDALVMHPGPMVRGMEIASEVADSARSTIVEQVANGVSVRMAVLYLLLGGADARAGGAPRRAGDAVTWLLRGVRVLGGDAADILIRGDRIVDVGVPPGRGWRAGARRRRPGCPARPRRPAHPPARARPRGRGDGRLRHAGRRAGRLHRGPCDGQHRTRGRHGRAWSSRSGAWAGRRGTATCVRSAR